MNFDYLTIESLLTNHPSLRLLRAEQAAFVASFLHRAFIVQNVRTITQADLVEALEDEVFGLRQQLGEKAFPRPALEYLNDWADNKKGWLRKFYKPGSDEPHFDLTPATEKAISWIVSLAERAFVGTESRLLTLFQLLKQMSEGSEMNPEIRIAELRRRRDEIDVEIEKIMSGNIPLLNDTAVKDRFQQFVMLARELLTDFREVEQNFRLLDRRVRERIAQWDGNKGTLLQEIMGERDTIIDSDQGRSFQAFWDFLMSSRRQQELSELLEKVLELPAVSSLSPDPRLRRVHYDWLEAGEYTQKTVAQLSHQLRRFLDDSAWLENRRIMDILRNIEARALLLRECPPAGNIMIIDCIGAEIELPMERPLYTPSVKARITDIAEQAADISIDAKLLFSQIVIDKAEIGKHIRQSLQDRSQITLSELIALKPLRHGLAELIAYLELATDTYETAIDDAVTDTITWNGTDGGMKQAGMPRVIFMR